MKGPAPPPNFRPVKLTGLGKVRLLEEDDEILRRASIFFAGALDFRNR